MKKIFFILFFVVIHSLYSQSLNFEATGTAPAWFGTDLNGELINVYDDYLNNNQILVVEYMNVYCGACQAYAPKLGDFYEEYGPNGLNQASLIGIEISTASNDEACQTYVDNYNATYPIININIYLFFVYLV